MILTLFVYAAPLALVLSLVHNYWQLRHVPGPFPASLTNLWRLWEVLQRKPHDVQLALHRRYGDVVRLGPNCVSVSGPEYTSAIYGIGKGFVKRSDHSSEGPFPVLTCSQ